jgi:ParB/RepB/Spo0J family partition protein
MGEFRSVPVADLEPPDDPDRQTSVMVDMDDLVADIKAHGLLQPICVEDMQDGTYRVFAGHRRSIAVTILQWKEVTCHVFQKDDPAIERMKASENMKRTQLTESEEALVYRRVVDREGKGAKEIALYFDRPFQRVQDLIDLTYGDPRVFELLGKGELSRAQAVEINRFETDVYRGLAIEQATKHGLKAPGLKRWRLDIANGGGEQQTQDILDSLKNLAPVPIAEPMQVCQIGNHASPLRLTKMYVICSEHWDYFMQGLEALHREEVAANGGG